jgi:multidrug resistance efflux pump
MKMEENKSHRKERIKTIAIIFLVIMLVLTFFSNTIMNYSLPQVATQRVTSATITAKVRGTGTVSATDPYNIVIDETRKIKSVKVKNGDTVEKDQVLFELEDVESEELTAARKTLEELQESYEKEIVSADSSSALVNQVENGTASSAKTVLTKIDTYNGQINSLNSTISSYNQRIAEIDSALSTLGDSSVDTSAEEKAVTDAEAKLSSAEAAVAAAENKLSTAQTSLTTVNGAVTEAEAEETAAKETMEAAAANYTADLTKEADLQDAVTKAEDSGNEAEKQDAEAQLKAFQEDRLNPDKQEWETAQQAYTAAQKNTESVKANNSTAIANAQKAVNDAQNEYNKAVSNQTACETDLNNKKAALTNKQNSSPDTSARDALTSERASLELKISQANQQLTDVQNDLQDLLTGYGLQTSLGSILDSIASQKELIAKLEAKTTDTVITAPVAGIVSNISYAAGESTAPGSTMAQVVSSEKGYTLSFSVTSDQAKKISVGDVADIQNSWYYDDLKAVVSGFRSDPDDRQKRLVIFTITGDSATDGQTLTLSVGAKSSTYDLVVPNSAIREDNNGKFILTVESKSSPLGNRYVATRVDVEVIASDDTSSAITAALYGYEYVITTSTQPVEAGQYVRFSE